MNVGDPNGTGKVQLLLRESDMLVVVKIPEKVKAGGAKGHYCKGVLKKFTQTKLIVMNQNRVEAEGQGELFKRRRP